MHCRRKNVAQEACGIILFSLVIVLKQHKQSLLQQLQCSTCKRYLHALHTSDWYLNTVSTGMKFNCKLQEWQQVS